jgi:hypothetical protein
MSNEVLMLIEKGLLNTLWTQAHPPVTRPPASIPPAAQPFAYAEIRGGAVRGGWKDKVDGGTTYEPVNIVWPQDIIDQFVADNAGDIFATYGWTQGNGLDNDGTNLGDYVTDPQGVLDIMLDHPDGGGAPTFTNPNWGHLFASQKERVFAGQFSLEFSREFF